MKYVFVRFKHVFRIFESLLFSKRTLSLCVKCKI
jgi:hypothetical protein